MKTTAAVIDSSTPSRACSFTGLVPVAELASRLGVADVLDAHLAPVIGDLSSLVHTPGSVLAHQAGALIAGGDDVSDIGLLAPLAHRGILAGLVPSTSTAHRRLHELGARIGPVEHACDQALRSLRTAAWAAAGAHAPGAHGGQVVVDIDATEIISHSEHKEWATPTWKKHFGHHPLVAVIDHGRPGTGELAAVMLRKGRAGSNTAADHIALAGRARAVLPAHIDNSQIVVRCDTAGGTRDFLAHLAATGIGYSVGIGIHGGTELANVLSACPDAAKQAIIAPDGQLGDLDDGYVVEITGLIEQAALRYGITTTGWPDRMRIIARVEYPAAGAQMRLTDHDGRRITCFATDQEGTPQHLDWFHRGRGRAEQRMRDLKDLGLSTLPHASAAANRAWLIAVTCAHNLLAWLPMITGPDTSWRRWEPKTWRARVFAIAATITRHARRLYIRLDGASRHASILAHIIARTRAATL